MKFNLDMTDYIIFKLCCLYFLCGYFYFQSQISKLKSKSWIISMLTTPILSAFGTYYAFESTYQALWTEEYIYNENMITRSVIIFFVASNLMDLVIGFFQYRAHLDILTSYIHHTFYTLFMGVILFSNYSTGFVICFLMEIPTAILAVGTVYPTLRNDLLFGITFFLTRILFNIYQAYQLRLLHNDGMIWKVCVLVLLLHIHWFYNWWRKYGLIKSTSKESHLKEEKNK